MNTILHWLQDQISGKTEDVVGKIFFEIEAEHFHKVAFLSNLNFLDTLMSQHI